MIRLATRDGPNEKDFAADLKGPAASRGWTELRVRKGLEFAF